MDYKIQSITNIKVAVLGIRMNVIKSNINTVA